jgi:hypothetical protein
VKQDAAEEDGGEDELVSHGSLVLGVCLSPHFGMRGKDL